MVCARLVRSGSQVSKAFPELQARRLGHATRLIEDESLVEYVNDARIALEICLTSNVQTRAVASIEQHPLREYFDRGLNVVLNTDNRLMSGVTLVDEYALAHERLGVGHSRSRRRHFIRGVEIRHVKAPARGQARRGRLTTRDALSTRMGTETRRTRPRSCSPP